MKRGWHIGWSGLAALAVGVACGSDALKGALGSADSTGSGRSADAGASGNPVFGGGAQSGAGGASGAGGTANLPPEKETIASFELPHAGPNYVYVANPASNSVAVINAKTQAIQIVEAGAQPRFLQTFGDTDAAIVLNVASFDATIVRTNKDTGASTTSKVSVQRGSNAIAVAPDGKHAVVYYDQTFSGAAGTPGSFQDVSVLTLREGADKSVGMTIGFRPSAVSFSADGQKAFIVTEDGVSILDFAGIEKSGAGLADLVPLGDPGLIKTLDVSITPDGRYALARQQNASVLRLVDLGSGAIQLLDVATLVPAAPAPEAGAPPAPIPGDAGDAAPPPPPTPPPATPPPPAPVTDLDLAPSGAYAMAVLRDRSAVVRLPIPDAFTRPSTATVTLVPGEIIGSVTLTPNEKYALLFTTVVDTNERLTILGLGAGEKPHSYQLRKSIQAIAVSPDDGTALVVHKKLPGDPNQAGLDVEAQLDRKNGYSVVQLDTGRAKLQVTAAPLGPFTIVPDGSELFILFNAAPLYEVQMVDLLSFQIHPIELGSPPISVGAVPASERVFVGQSHPDGRISFIDWKTAAVQSVTGFELNSRIRQ
jgi:YVTN family beta-propeller protein